MRARALLLACCAGAALGLGGAPAAAQVVDEPIVDPEQAARRALGDAPAEGLPEIELAPALTRRLEAPYLSHAEATDLRIGHGLWTHRDLDEAAAWAAAALQAGAWDHPALLEAADPIERAAGQVRRGELREALASLEGVDSIAALRWRAEALALLGEHQQADAVLDALVRQMQARTLGDAAALAEGVRGLMLRERLAGTRREVEGDEAARQAVEADFQTMVGLLARARDELDRMSVPPRLVEAELLLEKHNRRQAVEAAIEALSLNPSLAPAWAVLGRASVEGFDLDRAQLVALRLDELRWKAIGDDGLSSPLGDLLRSRAALRRRDPLAAATLLDALLERFPKMREALALRAATAAVSFDAELTARILERFEALSPGAPEALFEVGAALSEARQYEQAAEYLERAHRRLESWPEPVIELGLLEMQSGRDDRALTALRRAVRLDPFNARADNSLRLIEELISYDTVESEHFVVRFRPGPDEILAREMLPVLERIHRRVAGSENGGIDHEPDRKTVIELMPDHRWFSVRITGMPAIHTMAAATGPVIAMESPREGPGHRVGEYDWPAVLQHEYTHTVTLSRTKNRIPHWFTEAAAVYLEDAPRSWPWVQLLSEKYRQNELFDLSEISLRFVRPIEPTDRTQAYAQGHWMYEYIIDRWGHEAPLRLMDLYAAGRSEADAMREVLEIEPGAFMEGFRQWAREDLRNWGMLTPEGMPTMHELRREYFEDPDSEGAITPEAVERWLAAWPDHPDVLDLAVQQALSGRDREQPLSERTIDLLERLAAARPVDPTPRRHLVRHYLDTAQGEAAIAHLEWLDARAQHTPAYAAELARQHAALGDWASASLKAERATQIAPFAANEREFAARVALQSGDHATARRHLEALAVIEPDREIHRRRLEALDRIEAR